MGKANLILAGLLILALIGYALDIQLLAIGALVALAAWMTVAQSRQKKEAAKKAALAKQPEAPAEEPHAEAAQPGEEAQTGEQQ